MPGDDKETDDKSKGDDFAVKFKTEGEFLAAVDKKLKSRVKEATDTAVKDILAKLGVESPDDVEGVAEKLKASAGAQSEADKHKSTADKSAKELVKEQQKTAALTTKLHGLAKGAALMPFASQVRDTEALSLFVSPHLEVGEDGTVTGKDGKSVEDIVKGVLKAKDYLANPEFKAGAGTKAQGPKANLPFRDTGTDGKSSLTVGQAITNELVAQGKIAAPVNGVG